MEVVVFSIGGFYKPITLVGPSCDDNASVFVDVWVVPFFESSCLINVLPLNEK